MSYYPNLFSSKAVFGCLVCVLVASPACSQKGPSLARSVPVIVRDKHSLVIQGITPQDLVAKVNGKSARIASITVDSRPQRAVILLDTSASMKGTTEYRHWKFPLNIAVDVATSMSPNTQLAFLAFDETAHHVIGFSRGNAAVLDQLNQMAAAQAFSEIGFQRLTALYEAVYRGWQLIEGPSSADLLLVISDGDDNKSSLKPEALERTLTGSGVRFFAVRVRDLENLSQARHLDELGGPRELAEIAEKTGGEVFGPVGFRLNGVIHFAFSNYDYSDKTRLEDALSWFLQGMIQRQAAEIQVPGANDTEESLELKLSNLSAHKWKGATVSYPRKLLPRGTPIEPAPTGSQ